jgi:branched-chain amino acid transport system permease protein
VTGATAAGAPARTHALGAVGLLPALDSLVLVGLVLFPLLMPGYLDLGTRMIILVICAMSLDILVGYCGLVTLGHSAFFGVGASWEVWRRGSSGSCREWSCCEAGG